MKNAKYGTAAKEKAKKILLHMQIRLYLQYV